MVNLCSLDGELELKHFETVNLRLILRSLRSKNQSPNQNPHRGNKQETMKLFVLAGTASVGLGEGQWRALVDHQICADEFG